MCASCADAGYPAINDQLADPPLCRSAGNVGMLRQQVCER